MKATRNMLWVLCLMLALVFTAQAQDAEVEGNLTDGCVAEYDETVDYFPAKVSVEYAESFSVEYFNNYKVVSMVPWPGAEESLEYVLVQCGTPAPEGYEDIPMFEVPVQRFVAMTTTILPPMDEQGILDRLVAVDTTLFTSNENVLEMTASGDIVEIGGGGSGGDINFELLLSTEPDLVMAQEFYAGGTTLTQLQEAGIPAVLNADYADTSPLGQAEWGKYVALFFNTEAEANVIFDGIAERYQELVALTADVEDRPTVIAASPFSGTWYMPGADSTIAQLLADAGADFLWKDEPGTSVPLDMEVVVENGADAEYWVNANQYWQTTDDMLADDSRFAEFQALENGNIWNNNLRMNANGGSDYFESGAAHPDVILADLIKIFHPDLLPEHELVYYQQLASGE
ncbi:ABC transporter substrate-binding protein [Phototrophicus methaneseepsis]|uniref:ABC transporter substrate-binding protein n=1 Tax=Phototrophicus methaneseepsis TaxID=2710758 RepID=A0A7S8ECT7_9CHLR|nr:ABC transporter substrate-binding protein [Phototrophicus methaneseepsis]QPC84484.1 ABC transporter substrate-binding protein [Phototrophicus methaneseepsis]